jgi:hypothetical protein
MTIILSKFETDLLGMLLAGDNPVLSVLRKQLQNGTIRIRTQTEAGFYLIFDIPEDLPRITDESSSTKADFCFGDIEATVKGLNNGAGFLIWVKNGYLKQLEGYTYGEKWPLELSDYVLRYRDGTRNIDKLSKEWLLK